jgi:hypothetical protein
MSLRPASNSRVLENVETPETLKLVTLALSTFTITTSACEDVIIPEALIFLTTTKSCSVN